MRCREPARRSRTSRARRARPATTSRSRARTVRIVRAMNEPPLVLARADRRGPRRRGRGAAGPAGPPRRAAPRSSDAELERYSRQLVLPEWSEAAQLALREASVLVVGAGALGSPVALYLAGAGRRPARDRRRRRRRAVQPAPPDPALHARRRRPEGPQRGRQARLPQPARWSSSPTRCAWTRPTPPGWSTAPTSSSTAATPSRPATRSTRPAAPRASRSWRPACWARAGS